MKEILDANTKKYRVNEFVTLKVFKSLDGQVVYNIYNSKSHSDISLYHTTFTKIVSILTKKAKKNIKKKRILKK